MCIRDSPWPYTERMSYYSLYDLPYLRNGFNCSSYPFCSLYPVSYTHLDVYKRQTLNVPRLKGISFETAIIERYRRRESLSLIHI